MLATLQELAYHLYNDWTQRCQFDLQAQMNPGQPPQVMPPKLPPTSLEEAVKQEEDGPTEPKADAEVAPVEETKTPGENIQNQQPPVQNTPQPAAQQP